MTAGTVTNGVGAVLLAAVLVPFEVVIVEVL
jgi:hypothetical protein